MLFIYFLNDAPESGWEKFVRKVERCRKTFNMTAFMLISAHRAMIDKSREVRTRGGARSCFIYEVTGRPISRFLNIFAHLLTRKEENTAQGRRALLRVQNMSAGTGT